MNSHLPIQKKRKKHPSRIFLCILLLFLFSTGLLFLKNRYQPLTFQPSAAKESSKLLSNPYCGFYHLYGYRLSEDTSPDDAKKRGSELVHSSSYDLILLEVNLCEYSECDLTENALGELCAILQEFKSSNKQLILRFLYDWDGQALLSEPSDRKQILKHMEQLSDVLSSFASHIFLLQGTFTGNCGEMTQTNYGSEEDLTLLMQQLAKQTDPGIFLAVRTPAQLRSITKSLSPLEESSAFDKSLPARLGLFNDGMLGSASDLGTYDDTPLTDSSAYSAMGTREEEISFQNQLCRFVPNGGEVVIDNSYNDLENAITDFFKMHVSYLNCEHDSSVLNKWKSDTYQGDDVFLGCSGYDYIASHLGYRYVLTGASIAFDTWRDSQAKLFLSMKNTGFSPAYRKFVSTLTLKNEETKETFSLPVDFDNRFLSSGETSKITIPLDVRNDPPGTYRLFFSMKDPDSNKQIQFANEGADTSVFLGSLTLS